MSILIKGMEMPTRCFNCGMCEVDDTQILCCFSHGAYVEYRDIEEQIAIQDRPSWCPLIELPPHGLIDKQMLLRNIADNQMANAGQRHDLEYGFWQRMWEYINDAPTIIEADSTQSNALQRIGQRRCALEAEVKDGNISD